MASQNSEIPLLTEIVETRTDETRPHRILQLDDDSQDAESADPPQLPQQEKHPSIDEIESLIAELQTRLASRTFELTDELMRAAFADMEARVFRDISSKLRQQLPEVIDSIIREHLTHDQDDSSKNED